MLKGNDHRLKDYYYFTYILLLLYLFTVKPRYNETIYSEFRI